MYNLLKWYNLLIVLNLVELQIFTKVENNLSSMCCNTNLVIAVINSVVQAGFPPWSLSVLDNALQYGWHLDYNKPGI